MELRFLHPKSLIEGIGNGLTLSESATYLMKKSFLLLLALIVNIVAPGFKGLVIRKGKKVVLK